MAHILVRLPAALTIINFGAIRYTPTIHLRMNETSLFLHNLGTSSHQEWDELVHSMGIHGNELIT